MATSDGDSDYDSGSGRQGKRYAVEMITTRNAHAQNNTESYSNYSENGFEAKKRERNVYDRDKSLRKKKKRKKRKRKGRRGNSHSREATDDAEGDNDEEEEEEGEAHKQTVRPRPSQGMFDMLLGGNAHRRAKRRERKERNSHAQRKERDRRDRWKGRNLRREDFIGLSPREKVEVVCKVCISQF